MIIEKKKYYKLFFTLSLAIIVFFIINTYQKRMEKNLAMAEKTIVINLITSVHPNLA